MNGLEFGKFVQGGGRPVVTFLPKIHDQENCLDAGMRARVAGVEIDEPDEVVRINFDLTEFEEFNKQFESSNYYDKSGNPTLTAREAGQYNSKEYVYVDMSHEIDLFVIEEDSRVALYNGYLQSAADKNYVQWLEDRVLEAPYSVAQESKSDNPARPEVLLRAAYDILKQQHDATEVLNALSLTAHYDGTDCDGHCLMDDIAIELNIEEE